MRRTFHASRLALLVCVLILLPGRVSSSAASRPFVDTTSSKPADVVASATHAPCTVDLVAAQDGGDAQGRVRRPPEKPGTDTPRQGEPRAVPREQPKPRTDAQPRDERDRPPRGERREPPRRTEPPPRYFAAPHRFAFEPIDPHLGFYYHPYFGFYVGPYYGPFYPFPGPFPHTRFAVSSLRLKVKPVETEVYLNGYYAGIVDDFDGLFQRLYVPAGGHHLELRLEGHESYGRDIYVSAGDSMDVTHQMLPLRTGVRAGPPPAPIAVPDVWTADSHDLGQPASPYGILLVRTDPPDTQIFVDGEAWTLMAGQREFVMHLPAGSHQIEIRKTGYRTFATAVNLAPGDTTPLNVQLER